MSNTSEQSSSPDDGNAPGPAVARMEINFDGLRSAITPINLMFDGQLFKDLKGLIGNITHAMKKVNAERPDYQAALSEIDQLDATYRQALDQWEKKLTGEIQRLKTAVETNRAKSLGATKQISKYQAELNRGRASARSMPNKISQVRNQLIAACGERGSSQAASARSGVPKTRLSSQKNTFPVIYENATQQILRRAKKLSGGRTFHDLALAVFKSVSTPMRDLGDKSMHQGVLYYLHQTAASDGVPDTLLQQKAQFVVVTGINETGNCYVFRSVFPDASQNLEVSIEDLEQRKVSVFQPLETMESIIKLLTAKFKDDDFRSTFNLYHLLRKKALEDKRDEKFNPKQLAIHQYLTGQIFDFVGVAYDDPAAEIRFVGELNNALQRLT